MNKTCPICKKEYKLGYEGIGRGCDVCLGIKRDVSGHFWLPEETEHTYCDLEGNNEFVVKREEAFAPRL